MGVKNGMFAGSAMMLAAIGGISMALTLATPDTAFAGGNGKGKGSEKSSENSSHNSDKGGNGKIASQLKWRNSAHASATAMENSNGRPAHWAAFKEGYPEVAGAYEDAVAALAALNAMSDQEIIDAYGNEGDTVDDPDALAAAKALHEADVMEAQDDVDMAAGAVDQYRDEMQVGSEDLDDDAFDKLLSMLGL